jgi:hypothetical protein
VKPEICGYEKVISYKKALVLVNPTVQGQEISERIYKVVALPKI